MSSGDPPSFGHLLRHYRDRVGFTQSELAAAAGVSIDTVGKGERNLLRRPHQHTLVALAAALGLGQEERDGFLRSGRGHRAPDSMTLPPDADVGGELGGSQAVGGPPIDVVFQLGGRLAGAPPQAVGNALGLADVAELRAVCQRSVSRAVMSLPKYAPDLYVARDGIEREVDLFLSGERPCLAVLGEAGIGKTNLLCDLAMRWVTRFPILMVRGTTRMDGPLGLWRVLADELAIACGRSVDPAQLPSTLDALLRSGSRPMLVLIDGVNENSSAAEMRVSLTNAIADAVGTRIKFCLSCRDTDWRLFENDPGLANHLYEPRSSGGRATRALFIEPLTDGELAVAWDRYATHYGLHGELGPILRDICRHPLMLRFLCDAFRDGTIPPGIHRKEIFDRYWSEKLHVGEGHDTETALYKLAGKLYETRRTEVSQTAVIDLIGDREYERLLSERVILYSRRDAIYDQHLVGFTYDAFLEYAIARHLRQSWEWAWRSGREVERDLLAMLSAADEYRMMQGVLTYLLLFVEDTAVTRDFLERLAGRDSRWRIFICDFLLKVTDAELLSRCEPLLVGLVRDERFPVRWAAGNALGVAVQREIPGADDRLRALAESEIWMEREVAALAASHRYRDIPRVVSMLEPLADDINWRVRRAVGCALDNLCRTAREECFRLFTMWSRRRSPRDWRLRRAVAQAKYGLLLDPIRAQEILRTLASDPDDEVRWRTVSDLVAAAWHAEVRQAALAVLRRLASDPVMIVRRHLAFWVPALYLSGSDCAGIVALLVRDPSAIVRWTLARSLGGPELRSLASQHLRPLLVDPDVRVRFAARHSASLLDLPLEPEPSEADFAPGTSDEERSLWALRERLARSSRVVQRANERADIYSTWKPDHYANIRQILSDGAKELDTPERTRAFFLLLSADEDEGVRWALASLLPVANGLRDPAARAEVLSALMRDEHYWIRRESCSSVERLVINGIGASPELIYRIQGLAEDRNPEVRLAALQCLAACQERGVTAYDDDLFRAHLADDDRQVRGFSVGALARHAEQ